MAVLSIASLVDLLTISHSVLAEERDNNLARVGGIHIVEKQVGDLDNKMMNFYLGRGKSHLAPYIEVSCWHLPYAAEVERAACRRHRHGLMITDNIYTSTCEKL